MSSIADSHKTAPDPPAEVLREAAHEIIALYNLHHLPSVCNAIHDALALGVALMLEGPDYAVAVLRAGATGPSDEQIARGNARALITKYPVRFEQEPL